jgi:hypothetical protein
MSLGIQAKEINLGSESIWVLFGKLQAGCHVPFTEGWLQKVTVKDV